MLVSAQNALMLRACDCRIYCSEVPMWACNALVCNMHSKLALSACSCLLFHTPSADLCFKCCCQCCTAHHWYMATEFSHCILCSATAYCTQPLHCTLHNKGNTISAVTVADHDSVHSPPVYGTDPLCWSPSQSAHAPWPGRSTAAVGG